MPGRVKEKETEVFHLLVHCQNGCDSRGYVGWWEPRTSNYLGFFVDDRAEALGPSTAAVPKFINRKLPGKGSSQDSPVPYGMLGLQPGLLWYRAALASPFLIQFFAKVPGKRVEDNPSPWAHATLVGDLEEIRSLCPPSSQK